MLTFCLGPLHHYHRAHHPRRRRYACKGGNIDLGKLSVRSGEEDAGGGDDDGDGENGNGEPLLVAPEASAGSLSWSARRRRPRESGCSLQQRERELGLDRHGKGKLYPFQYWK